MENLWDIKSEECTSQICFDIGILYLIIFVVGPHVNIDFKIIFTCERNFQNCYVYYDIGELFFFFGPDKNKTLCLRMFEDNSNSQKLSLFCPYIIDEYRVWTNFACR